MRALWSTIYWYDAKIHDKDNAVTSLDEKKNATLNNALLKASTRIRLISKRELEDVAKITLDGELVEWRQGGELVNGVNRSSAKSCCISVTDAARQSRSVPARSANSSKMPIRSCPRDHCRLDGSASDRPETMKRDQLRNDQVSEQDD